MMKTGTDWNRHNGVGATLLENWVEERAVGDRILDERASIAYLSQNGHKVILHYLLVYCSMMISSLLYYCIYYYELNHLIEVGVFFYDYNFYSCRHYYTFFLMKEHDIPSYLFYH